MTRERDIEHVLEAWLEPGPREAPDRVLLAITDRIDRVPQRRFPQTNERFHHMTPILKLTAAAVLAIAVGVAVGPRLATPDQVLNGQPSPDPSPSPTMLPPAMVGDWVTDFKNIDGLVKDTTQGTGMQLMTGSLRMTLDSAASLVSKARLDAAGDLVLESVLDSSGCARGDLGTYPVTVSGSNPRTLTIAPGTDTCPIRAAALPGAWASYQQCELGGGTCLGPLSAGTHRTIAFQPRAALREDDRLHPGGLTYTVPGGWTDLNDWPDEYHLGPIDPLRAGTAQSDDWRAQIWVEAQPAPLDPTAMCTWKVDSTVGRTASDLVAFLVDHPALTTSDPVSTTVDGHPATILDIDLDPAWTGTCADLGIETPFVPLFADSVEVNADGTLMDNSSRWGPGGWKGQSTDPQRYVIVDLGDGEAVVILITSARSNAPADNDAAGQAAFVERAMPIVESFVFAG